MDVPDWSRRFASSPFAVLATHGPDGRLDLVPCCFALVAEGPLGGTVVTAVDHKPKRHQRLQRLVNIDREPTVSMLVDHRHDDWTTLWWVRLEGRAEVHRDGPLRDEAAAALARRHTQYRDRPPAGPAIVVTPERWSGWTATGA